VPGNGGGELNKVCRAGTVDAGAQFAIPSLHTIDSGSTPVIPGRIVRVYLVEPVHHRSPSRSLSSSAVSFNSLNCFINPCPVPPSPCSSSSSSIYFPHSHPVPVSVLRSSLHSDFGSISFPPPTRFHPSLSSVYRIPSLNFASFELLPLTPLPPTERSQRPRRVLGRIATFWKRFRSSLEKTRHLSQSSK